MHSGWQLYIMYPSFALQYAMLHEIDVSSDFCRPPPVRPSDISVSLEYMYAYLSSSKVVVTCVWQEHGSEGEGVGQLFGIPESAPKKEIKKQDDAEFVTVRFDSSMWEN